MNDRWKIVIGLLVFLGLMTLPVWANLGGGAEALAPQLTLPTGETDCVAPTEYMRTSHMDLLVTWRDQVVRENDRVFIDHKGREFQKSLTNTCLDCHSNKAEFCDRCHNYVGVTPPCWNCHNERKEAE